MHPNTQGSRIPSFSGASGPRVTKHHQQQVWLPRQCTWPLRWKSMEYRFPMQHYNYKKTKLLSAIPPVNGPGGVRKLPLQLKYVAKTVDKHMVKTLGPALVRSTASEVLPLK